MDFPGGRKIMDFSRGKPKKFFKGAKSGEI